MSYSNAVREVEKAPLADRKEASAEFEKDMAENPSLVGERLGWLLDGNYGFDEMMSAARVLKASARANKEASLVQMIGVLEWRCTPRDTAKNWLSLNAQRKAALSRAVQAAMKEETEAHRRMKDL